MLVNGFTSNIVDKYSHRQKYAAFHLLTRPPLTTRQTFASGFHEATLPRRTSYHRGRSSKGCGMTTLWPRHCTLEAKNITQARVASSTRISCTRVSSTVSYWRRFRRFWMLTTGRRSRSHLLTGAYLRFWFADRGSPSGLAEHSPF